MNIQNKTKGHYENYPFDFLANIDLKDIKKLQPAPFKFFAQQFLKKGQKVIDIGCGPGRAALYLTNEGHSVYAVDLSLNSLLLARSRIDKAYFILASNHELPFHDESFDAAWGKMLLDFPKERIL